MYIHNLAMSKQDTEKQEQEQEQIKVRKESSLKGKSKSLAPSSVRIVLDKKTAIKIKLLAVKRNTTVEALLKPSIDKFLHDLRTEMNQELKLYLDL
jgi:hypothetical protein